jgi:FtsP/CotA-like multicopper oxidase with cupredoxin domain
MKIKQNDQIIKTYILMACLVCSILLALFFVFEAYAHANGYHVHGQVQNPLKAVAPIVAESGLQYHHSHNHSPLEDKLNQSIEAETGFEMDSHEQSEGPVLGVNLAEHTEVLYQVGGCPSNVPLKIYDVVAIEVTMVLNRWGDRDPQAYMFALRGQLPAIRAQEVADEADHFGLSLGLGADPIQPLTIRANVGDCVRVMFTNELAEPASFHVHGTDFIVRQTGEPALSTNPASIALPSETIEYEWYVAPDYYSENTHYLHSHGPKARWQVSHGLFGALIVEPEGSEYFDQRSGEALCRAERAGVQVCQNTWDAMISPGNGSSDFREFTLFYHEIGNAKFLPVDKDGVPNPSLDPFTGSYRPNSRAINYRSESFWRRLGPMEELMGFSDKSQAYGTYTFGEPAMPIPQSYLGDPVKMRLVHGGSETFHVPHLHGGGIQWQRQPDMGQDGDPGYTPIDAGLKKHFANTMPSSGNDSQTIGPSETYELEISCGSGGCQQTVGDFLFHCHVASHYISGMWHFWRVYNTLQDASHKTDDLSLLVELPDRRGRLKPAVTSTELIGREVDFAGRTIEITEANLASIVETQLPPPGLPYNQQDATVMDWIKEGPLYLNEPESSLTWPNFTSPTPGERLPFKFDPITGKLAYPTLRPHLGKRPPFAPNHGPAPFLEPLGEDRGEPAAPGANGPDSLCPTGAPRRLYKLHAIQTEIPVSDQIIDPDGMLFVVKENEERARGDPEFKVPLAIRANQGDCVDIIFVNELEETGEDAELSKTNIHIHFVQFDVQASDGVISGASFEQSPRPFSDPGMSFKIQEDADVGASSLALDNASSFHVGTTVAIGLDQQSDIFETAVIKAIKDNTLILEHPIKNPHRAGEHVSVEFVRYRWYVARQNGAIYFHDHVDALTRWGHGLFGALIAEPEGSTYHHPQTGEEILSGPMMDIHTGRKVLPGLEGSFREYVLFFTDHNKYTGSSVNLRAEPLRADTDRGRGRPHLALSSVMYGDPATPVLKAYVGDPIIFRLLTSATEEIHPFHITGHHFRWERFQANSPPLTVFGLGISERFNAYVEAAGGTSGQAGDYLYYNGAERHFREGSWGILRAHDTLQPDLKPLPGREPPAGSGFPQLSFTGAAPSQALGAGEPCPASAPQKFYSVSAIEYQSLTINAAAGLRIPTGRMYVLDSDVEAVYSGLKRPEPLVIRANAGDCVTIQLTNQMNQPASLHLDSPAFDPQGSLGITLGYNPDQAVQPGETIVYRYYAEQELGAVLIRDFGNLFRNAREGLYGALIVEPEGSTYVDPYTGEPLLSGVEAAIQNPDLPDFREFVTLFQDNDPDIGLFIMPYDEEVNRLVAVNYRGEPLALRLAQFGVLRDRDPLSVSQMTLAKAMFDSRMFGDPNTNLFETFGGDPVRYRVLSAYSEQPQVFSVEAHEWQLTPQLAGSDVVSARYLPPTGVLNVELMRTGGPQQRPGDYQWGNHRLPYEKAGQWGLMRIFGPGSDTLLKPLPDRDQLPTAEYDNAENPLHASRSLDME